MSSTTTELLRGELERLFDVEQMRELCREYLGIEPADAPASGGKGAFARTVVERCAKDDATDALVDAIFALRRDADPKLRVAVAERPTAELAPGTSIGPYKIARKLGEGGVGIVYLAEEGTEQVAIKVVREAYCGDRRAVRRFLTAARIAKTVRVPGVVRVLAVGEIEGGRPYVAMEFVDGTSLASRIAKTGPLHYAEARPIVRSLLETLAEVHARGLVHGDLKAENVLVVHPAGEGKPPRVVLVDFGTDRLRGTFAGGVERTGQVAFFGTPKSVAPEQARGLPPSARTDVYAAGALLYEVFTGRAPFTGRSAIDVVAQHLTADPEPPSLHAPKGWVSRDLDAVVQKALAKDPAARYEGALQLLEAFQACSREKQRERATGEAAVLDSFVNALLENPADEARAEALEKAAGDVGDWEGAARSLEDVAELAEVRDAKISLLFRAARVLEAEIKDAARAEAAYRKVLDLDPENDLARVAIEELGKGRGRFEDVIEMLLQRVERAENTAERVAGLRDIARIYESEMKDPGAAFQLALQALKESPRDDEVAADVERLAEASNQWPALLHDLSQHSQADLPGADATALYVRLGGWYAAKLGRPDFALACFQKALVLTPDGDDAMGGAEDIYRASLQWNDLVAILVRRAEAQQNPVRARTHLADAARVLDQKLGDTARAGTIYASILDEDPQHEQALAALEKIYAAAERWRDLVPLLDRRAAAEKGAARAETLAQIAEIFEDRLSDEKAAMDRYEQVLVEDATNLPALKGLERLYARAGQFRHLLRNLEAQLGVAATPRQKMGLLERIAALHEEEFVDAARAAETYEQLVEIDADNEKALAALVRQYRALERWDDAASTMLTQSRVTTDRPAKVALLVARAHLLEDHGSPAAALEAYGKVLDIVPDDADVLARQAHLRTDLGEAKGARETLEKLAAQAATPAQKAELCVRIARIHEKEGEGTEAEAAYKRALDADPSSTLAAAALRAIYLERGDAAAAISMGEQELAATQGATARSAVLAEIGRMRLVNLGDAEKAETALRDAIALDPTNVAAAEPLADIHFDAERWSDAADAYERLTARAEMLSNEAAVRIWGRLGEAWMRLGEGEKALEAFKAARDAAPHDRAFVRRLADVAYDHHRHGEARSLYAEYLSSWGDEIAKDDRVEVLFRLGDSKRHAGDLEGALHSIGQAREADSKHVASAKALAEIHTRLERWDDAVTLRLVQADLDGGDERFAALMAAGDLLREKVLDRVRAAKTYAAALDAKPDDRTVLARLMQIYSEDKDWKNLLEVVLRIAEQVQDEQQLAKYFQTAALICHMELGRLEEALEYYAMALDHDTSLTQSFESMVQILTTQQDWAGLEEAFRKRLDRLPESTTNDQKAHLWHSLAEVLHHRLDREADAVAAYERAQDLAPDSRRRMEALAELYERDLRRFGDRAITTHAEILRKNSYRIDSYRALRRIYTERKRPDESWCMCQALAVLKGAEAEEEQFFVEHRPGDPAYAQSVLSDDLWNKHMRHPEQDPLLSGLFAVIAPVVLEARGTTAQKAGLDPEWLRDPATEEHPLGQTFNYAGAVLAVPAPPLYFREDQPGGLSFAFTSPVAFVAGAGALEAADPQALSFVVGRYLAYLRGGNVMRWLVPTGTGLRAWLLAAIKLVTPGFPVPDSLAQPVADNQLALKRGLQGQSIDALTSIVTKLVQEAGSIDLKRWVAAVDYTADRAGFLLANDLEVAEAAILGAPEDGTTPPQKERRKELFLFAVGQDYFTLRQRLGISLQVPSEEEAA